jgi:signal transduction histidine kinase
MSHRKEPATASRPVGSDGASRVVAAALFTPLVLLLIVAAMTWRSERRAAAVADRVVHDYAAIAVWQYARRVNSALHEIVMGAFSGGPPPAHQRTNPETAPDPPSMLLAHDHGDSSRFRESARFAFNYDPATDRLDAAGDTLGARTLDMLHRRLRAASRRSSHEPHRILFDSADGRSYAIALLVIGPEGMSPTMQGIATDANILEPVFAKALREPGLLPAVGADHGLTGDLALRLTRADGAVLFATTRPLGRTAATDTTGLHAEELRATLDLPPALARELLIGEASGSQLPSLGLMILAATVLAVIGLVQHSRSRALAQARTRFVANASHELRTPLAQISMFAETLYLGRERNEAERRQFAGIVFAEARRLTALVENVLRFSRSEHAEPLLRLHSHDLAELIGSAVSAFAPIAAAAQVHVEVNVPDEITVNVDAAAFQQVMLNLLDNAVKHGGGRVAVAASVDGGEVMVTVDDAGPGVPVEWRSRVFEPFAQVSGRNVTGAGIGLAIVHDLMTAHGGRTWIESSPLGGARVLLTLRSEAAVSTAPRDPTASVT